MVIPRIPADIAKSHSNPSFSIILMEIKNNTIAGAVLVNGIGKPMIMASRNITIPVKVELVAKLYRGQINLSIRFMNQLHDTNIFLANSGLTVLFRAFLGNQGAFLLNII